MAAFGSVTTLVASLLALLCSVVGAPMDPNNYFNHLGRPFDSVSHAFHSNQPAEHESGFGWNDSDPPVDYRYGSQGGLSGPPAREHNARNAAARNHERQGGASRYSPYMTSNNPVGGALSNRGGVGSSGQHTGYQHQPSASVGPGPGSYGVFEPRPQHQHLSSPGGGGSYKLDELLLYTPEQLDEMASILNSPDVVPPPSALPRSHTVRADAPRDAAVGRKRRKSKGRLKDLTSPGGEGSYDLDDLLPYTREQIDEMVSIMNSPDVVPPPPSAIPNAAEDAKRRRSELARELARVRNLNKEFAIKVAQTELVSKNQETILDLKKRVQDGEPTLDPASALARLTRDDLRNHAGYAFRRESTALQPRIQRKAEGYRARAYVHSTNHQSAIVQELINRRLRTSTDPEVNAQRIRVTVDPEYKATASNIGELLLPRFDPYRATKDAFEAPRKSPDTPAYHEPFKMGEYEIYVLGSDSIEKPPPVFAIHATALDDLRATMTFRPPDTTDASSRNTDKKKPPSVFLGRISRAQ